MTKQKAAAAGLWSALDIVLRQGVQFVVTIVLARLLTPEDFGIIALMGFFTALSIAFAQSGLTMGLVQRQDTSREEESAVFWWNLAIALIFSTILVAAGPALAAFYGHPILASLMWIAAAQIILSALGAVQTALLTRDLRFDQLTRVGIVSSVLAGGAGIGVAVMGGGIWALAAQSVAASAVGSAGMWLASPWRPSAHWHFRTGGSVFKFGTWVSLGNLLEVLYTQGSALLIGKLYGVRDLGFYNRAASTQWLPSAILGQIVGRIALPLFAARAAEPDALRRGLRMAIGLAMMLNLPAMVALAILSPEVILVLFGAKWLPAAPILSILAISGIFLPLHAINLQMVLAQGNTRIFLRNEIAKKTIGVGCMLVGSLFGIVGLAYSQIAYSLLAVIVNTRPSHVSLGYGLTRQLRDLSGLFLATLAMAAGLILLKATVDLDPLPMLAVCTAAGGLLYLLTGLALRSASFTDALSLLPLPRFRPAPSGGEGT
ncbi:MAG TPA: lipopolysaccharide biosynthesis protein [Allosphingosinicella sp.]|jgi:O-antigen/teichoic acid export membrane protein